MESQMNRDETIQKTLLHLYNSVVVGSVKSMAMIMRMGGSKKPKKERLKAVFDLLGSERESLFYGFITSITEFAVYSTLDFIEHYNRFDSEVNDSQFPRVDIIYSDFIHGNVRQIILSKFGAEELGEEWLKIAQRDDINELVESAINNLIKKKT